MNEMGLKVYDAVKKALEPFKDLSFEDKVQVLNLSRLELHKLSPFCHEPVDCVLWVPSEGVVANDYNPNSVAPPEMRLLEHSINEDGYTQPIVAWSREKVYEVIDGFHRHRVGKECQEVRGRVKGHLPVVVINNDRQDKTDRMASTIRHNRARGKHKIDGMSDIVVELKRRNWSDERISRELGMDQDEVLRLCQITGLSDLFKDQEFSKSWDIEGEVNETDFKELTDDVSTYGEEAEDFRTVNTSDEGRIFHTYEKWECYKAGFYNNSKEGMKKEEGEKALADFLSSPERFEEVLKKLIVEWKFSCEHYLTNKAMNRIAWLGQAAGCYALGIPSTFRGGFSLMTKEAQDKANAVAFKYLNVWLANNNLPAVTMEEAIPDRQSQIY